MAQRRILKREQEEEMYDNISKMLSLSRRNVGSSYRGINHNEICFNISILSNNTISPSQSRQLLRGIDINHFNNNTSNIEKHALGLIGKRRMDRDGNIKFVPHNNNELLSHADAGALITSLNQLKNEGFTNIYTGYNSKHEVVVGTCVDYKVPQYARIDGIYMKINYAISLIETLSHMHLVLRNDIITRNEYVRLRNKRIHYKSQIETANRVYRDKIAKYAKIVDIAMQGMKKKDKIRALHNLCINDDDEWGNDNEMNYTMRARQWLEENPFTQRNVEITESNINIIEKRIGYELRNIDCEVTIAKKIYDYRIEQQLNA